MLPLHLAVVFYKKLFFMLTVLVLFTFIPKAFKFDLVVQDTTFVYWPRFHM